MAKFMDVVITGVAAPLAAGIAAEKLPAEWDLKVVDGVSTKRLGASVATAWALGALGVTSKLSLIGALVVGAASYFGGMLGEKLPVDLEFFAGARKYAGSIGGVFAAGYTGFAK